MTHFLDDISLFEKIQTGNKESFDILFKKYFTPLCRYTVQFVKDYSIAEELVQDVFIYFWNQREEIKISKSIASYLFTSARYRSYTHFRNETSRKENEKIFCEGLENDESAVNDEKDFYEIAVVINKAIEELPDKCKEIFVLSREKNLTYKQISEELNISVKTVENQMGIAFKKLRSSLSEKLKGEGFRMSMILL